MNMEIGTEAAQFPEKEYISGIFLAVGCSVTNYSFTSELFSFLQGFASLDSCEI